jgi:tetratricopeptide (TPR) repeat protein
MIVLYILPVFAFVIGYLLVAAGQSGRTLRSSVVSAALFSAAVGVLIHNLIDFAIFEPGVFTTLWAVVACLIASKCNRATQPALVLGPSRVVRLLTAAAGLAALFAYLHYGLVPVVESNAKIGRAHQAMSVGRFEQAHELLDSAAKADHLSSAPLSMNAKLYLGRSEPMSDQQVDSLLRAEQCLLSAVRRNSADFKNFERLTEVYGLLAKLSAGQDRAAWLSKAFESASDAVERYPGCARLRIELAKTAELMGRTDTAIEQYKQAIDIEDSYRRQFAVIYPEEDEIVSRLGEDQYFFAKARLKALSGQ